MRAGKERRTPLPSPYLSPAFVGWLIEPLTALLQGSKWSLDEACLAGRLENSPFREFQVERASLLIFNSKDYGE